MKVINYCWRIKSTIFVSFLIFQTYWPLLFKTKPFVWSTFRPYVQRSIKETYKPLGNQLILKTSVHFFFQYFSLTNPKYIKVIGLKCAYFALRCLQRKWVSLEMDSGSLFILFVVHDFHSFSPLQCNEQPALQTERGYSNLDLQF